jgi:hypothetical protein
MSVGPFEISTLEMSICGEWRDGDVYGTIRYEMG